MELEQLDKYIHLTQLASGVEVMFAGQVCLVVQESPDGYFWRANPLFAKLTYGANVWNDVPFCLETLDSIEEAVAAGLSELHALGAFYGSIDLPEDTYVEEHLDESTQIDEVSHQELLAAAQKAYISATKQGNGTMAKAYAADILKHKANIAKQKTVKESEEQIDEAFKMPERATYDKVEAHSKRTIKAINRAKTDPTPENKQSAKDHRAHLNKLTALRNKQIKNGTLKSSYSSMHGGHIIEELDEEEQIDELSTGAKIKYFDKSIKNREELQARIDANKDVEGADTSDAERKVDNRNKGLQSVVNSRFGRKTVKESVIDDCIAEAKNHEDDILKIHALAQGLYEAFLEDVSEAALSGDAYWKAKEDEAAAAKAKTEREKMGIKEPAKRGRGKPTNIDRDALHARAKENVKAGKRPTTGFDRNEKIHFVRHLKNHPDFSEHHVAKAGRPVGTTKAAGEEKVKEKKQAASAFSMWSGLGKR